VDNLENIEPESDKQEEPASPPDLTECPFCAEPIEPGDAFCTHCGFPIMGSDEEQRAYRTKRWVKEDELGEMKRRVRQASNTMFGLAVLFFLAGLYYYGMLRLYQNPGSILLINWIVAAVYIGLGLWSRTQPAAAIVSGLIFYAIVTVLSIIDNPDSLLSIVGLVLKLIIIALLINGMNSAYKAERIKKELLID
jgi:hypothetical protein